MISSSHFPIFFVFFFFCISFFYYFSHWVSYLMCSDRRNTLRIICFMYMYMYLCYVKLCYVSVLMEGKKLMPLWVLNVTWIWMLHEESHVILVSGVCQVFLPLLLCFVHFIYALTYSLTYISSFILLNIKQLFFSGLFCFVLFTLFIHWHILLYLLFYFISQFVFSSYQELYVAMWVHDMLTPLCL